MGSEGSGVVRTASGQVRGEHDPASGTTVFRGIPFAKPPVGDLRWKAPQLPEPWQEVRDCTAFGASCVQPKGEIVLGVRGAQSEDWLFHPCFPGGGKRWNGGDPRGGDFLCVQEPIVGNGG